MHFQLIGTLNSIVGQLREKKMYLFCKDAKPKDTIKRIKSILRKAGFEVEEASWKHPAPHVWSVHVRERSCHILFSN